MSATLFETIKPEKLKDLNAQKIKLQKNPVLEFTSEVGLFSMLADAKENKEIILILRKAIPSEPIFAEFKFKKKKQK